MTESCPFCDIWAGDALATVVQPSSVVDGCAGVLGIVPLNPVVPGHVIFIPRLHVKDALERPGVTGDVVACAARYANRHAAYDSCNIITSIGVPATQSVLHLHVHVVPRQQGDGLKLPWSDQVTDG